jgi:hypothetical protein
VFSRSTLSCAAAILVLAGVLSCGREPTDPSRSNLTGHWESTDRDLYITNISMDLHQDEPGIVFGRWRAIGKVDNSCPLGQICTDSSTIQGRAEVAQVVLHLFGAGDFVGEQTKTNELKGAIRSLEQNFHVTFTRK